MKVRLYKCSVCKTQKDVDIKDFEAQVANAAKEAGVEIEMSSVTDREEANKEGVWELPAIAVDGQLIVAGYFPKDKELIKEFAKI